MAVSTLPLWKGVEMINVFQNRFLYDMMYVICDATV